ncbi:MAG: SPFH domain-containing protein [Lachnospiraceae bacterium]|nr:SPFH domain-containing protein [Lachnospiraceae bacterium]
MDEKLSFKNVEEKELNPMSGGLMLIINILMYIVSIGSFVMGIISTEKYDNNVLCGVFVTTSVILLVVAIIVSCGFKVINPNEELVLTFFGKYYGTIKKDGFYFVNPFASGYNPTASAPVELSFASGTEGQGKVQATNTSVNLNSKKISTKTQTLKNDKQKVNDVLGNPIIIGSVVIWRVAEPTKAVFNVENYKEFLSIQCDSVIRNIARMYPYDSMEDDVDEKTLRGSSQEIADSMRKELQEKVQEAGLEIKEVRITNLAYSDEIAAAMLQRQQAVAVIAARQKIVEGAVSMVKMAIDQLGEEDVVVLDEERKAAMVSNLLVVLCGNKDAQPIVNSGSIY